MSAVVSSDWLLQERGQECNSSGNSGSGGSVSIGPLVNNTIPHPPPHTCDYLGMLYWAELTSVGRSFATMEVAPICY